MRPRPSVVLLGIALLAAATTRAHAAGFVVTRALQNPSPASTSQFGLLTVAGDGYVFTTARDADGAQVLHVYDASGALLRTLHSPQPHDGTFAAAVAGGSTVWVSGAGDGTPAQGDVVVHAFDAASGALLRTVPVPTTPAGGFGIALAVAGGVLAVGMPGEASAGDFTGAVYLFDAATGTPTHVLADATPAANEWFGASLAGLGDDVLVGAYGVGEPNGGVAYLFDGATGALLQTFTNPTPAAKDFFADGLASIDGDVLVGAPLDDAAAVDAGAVYRFDAATGALLKTYLPPGAPSQLMGSRLGVWGGRIFANAPGALVAGAVRVFDAASGASTDLLPDPDPERQQQFGNSIAVAGSTVWVGAPTDAGARGIGGELFAFDLCGDAQQAPLEGCDDGNTLDGDGCSATCRAETCPPVPLATCEPAAPRSALLRIKAGAAPVVGWKLASRAPSSALGFGDPLSTASLLACAYDASGAPQPLLGALAPAGGQCGAAACWRAIDGGVQYRDRAGTPDGIATLRLQLRGKLGTRASLGMRGPNLAAPTLPLTAPARLQLLSTGSAACWDSRFPTAVRNDAKVFKARSE